MQTTRQKAVGELAKLGTSENTDDMAKVAALNSVIKSQDTVLERADKAYQNHFHRLSLLSLTVFFLRCTFALIPTALLVFALYIISIFFSTAFVQLVVG